MDEWEERNKQIASERGAIQKISQKLVENFNPDEILQYLVANPSSDNPYYQKLEVLAEEQQVSVEKLLAKKPSATVKLNGDIVGLVKEWLENRGLDYELYKKIISGDKKTIISLFIQELIKKALSVEFTVR